MSTEHPLDHPRRPPRTGGRIRSQEAREAALAAAIELLEEVGYQGVTIEGIAARSQVAKSTLYRWWKSKGPLVMDAYQQTVEGRVPEPDTGTVAGDLTAFLADLYRAAGHPLRAKALRGLMAEAQLDPAFAEHFQQWVQSRRDAVMRMLARGVDRGELPTSADLDWAVDLLFGPFWYRMLVGHAPLEPDQAPRHVTHLLNGLRGPTE